MKNLSMAAVAALALAAVSVAPAQAGTFATANPTGTAANISLSGLTLSANTPVKFDFLDPSLSAAGKLDATWTLTATETGAIAFGPISLGSFDGSFSYTYTGPTGVYGGHSFTTGENLLSGSFLGSVFTGYGSTGGLQDSILAGGIVNFSSDVLTFSGIGDEGLTTDLNSITPTVKIISGKLTPFGAVAQSSFAADDYTITSGAPEPAAWSLMILGVGGMGGALRTRRRKAVAA